MTPEQEWGAELKRVMTRQGVNCVALAEATGLNVNTIKEFRRGARVPRAVNAAKMADALMAPHLLDTCIALRTKECEECGASFTPISNRGQVKYCSPACRTAVSHRIWQRARADTRQWNGARWDTWKRRAQKSKAAIAAHCRACSGSACYNATCDLRGESPLPLVQIEDVRVPRRKTA